MKKKVSLIIIGLIGLVFVIGIIATSMSITNHNSKIYIMSYDYLYLENYAKDGRIKVNSNVSEDQKYLYVKDTSAEIITRAEYLRRTANNFKIRMDKAEKDYLDDQTESNRDTYNNYKIAYEQAMFSVRNYGVYLFTISMSTFFGTYFIVIVLLAIALMINQKINYKCRKDKETPEQ